VKVLSAKSAKPRIRETAKPRNREYANPRNPKFNILEWPRRQFFSRYVKERFRGHDIQITIHCLNTSSEEKKVSIDVYYIFDS
jgi:hypothetical protein